jgi:hypothetical protein
MGSFDFIAYMRDIAESLKEIQHTEDDKHFSRASSIADLGEFLAGMSNAKGYQLIIIDNLAGRFLDHSSDNLLMQPYFSFYLVKQIPREDFDKKEELVAACMAICKKILSKLFKDKRNTENGLTNLDRDSITYNQAGPFGHNWYGLNFNFTILDDPDITFDEDDWQPFS